MASKADVLPLKMDEVVKTSGYKNICCGYSADKCSVVVYSPLITWFGQGKLRIF